MGPLFCLLLICVTSLRSKFLNPQSSIMMIQSSPSSRWRWAVANFRFLSRHQSSLDLRLPLPVMPDLFVCSDQCWYACFCPCDVHEQIVRATSRDLTVAQDSCCSYAALCLVCSPFAAAGCNYEHGVKLRRKLGVQSNPDLCIQHCCCPRFALAQELRTIKTMSWQTARAPLRQRMS